MSCQRAYDIDLAAFLADPRSDAHAGFREHYPRCARCAAEVRAWTELEGLLRPPQVHPAPEKLLALEDAREGLGPVERAALEEHVAGCASCRDELRALRGFAEQAPGPAATAPTQGGGGSALGALLAGIRSVLVQPAFAYALALLFAAPTLYRLVVAEDELLRRPALERQLEERERPADASRDNALPAPALEERAAPAPGEPAAPQREDLDARAAPAAGSGPSAPSAPSQRAAPDAKAKAETEGLRSARRPEQVHQEQLRALGYVDETRPVETPGSAEGAARKRAAVRAEAPAPAGAAESFAAAPRASADALADEAREADRPGAERARVERRAAPARPAFEPGAAGVVRLRVPLEPGMAEVEVRVTPPGGGRMLAEHFRGAAGEVVLEIPAFWMEAGTWRVERRALGRSEIFEVEAP
jgi:hypothetical protein